MDSTSIAAPSVAAPNANGLAHRRNPVHPLGGSPRGRDVVSLGRTPLTSQDEMRVILESAYAKIQGVVDDAKAELGIEAGAVIDTSPEATANRILDFALGFFEQYRENHSELGDEEAREQYAEFIGGAIQEGIDEAREILGALSAIDETTESGIVSIEGLIQDGLNAFVLGN